MRGKPTRYFGKVCALHPELKGEWFSSWIQASLLQLQH